MSRQLEIYQQLLRHQRLTVQLTLTGHQYDREVVECKQEMELCWFRPVVAFLREFHLAYFYESNINEKTVLEMKHLI